MDRMRTEWASMSNLKKSIYGALIIGGLLFIGLTTTGTIDLFAVDTGVQS